MGNSNKNEEMKGNVGDLVNKIIEEMKEKEDHLSPEELDKIRDLALSGLENLVVTPEEARELVLKAVLVYEEEQALKQEAAYIAKYTEANTKRVERGSFQLAVNSFFQYLNGGRRNRKN